MVSLKFSSPSQAPQPMYWFKKNDSLATRCSLPACFRFHVREGPIQHPHHCGGLFCIVYRNYIYTHAVQTLGGVWYMIKESSDRKRGENSIQSSIKKCFRFFFLFGVTVMFIRSSSSFLPCEGGHLIQASHPLIGVNFSLRSHTVSLALAYVIPAFHPGVTCFCSNTTAVLPQLEQDTRMSQIITGNYPV